jgi:hypothetical protein
MGDAVVVLFIQGIEVSGVPVVLRVELKQVIAMK